MSYRDKCEELFRQNEILKKAIKTIDEMEIDITDMYLCIQDIAKIKAITRTILVVVGDDDNEL